MTANYRPDNSLEPPLVENINFSTDWEEFLKQITRLYGDIARKVNIKDRGYYLEQEILNDQKYFTDGNPLAFRDVYRTVVDFGALPNTANKTVAHGITWNANMRFTRIYGTATNPSNQAIPIPYVDPAALANGIQLDITAANVSITTAANYAAYTTCYVVIEYVKT